MYVCYQGTKSLPPTTVCDSATLFDTILVCAVLCRAQRSEAAPTWLPSLWSRTRRCPAPYPTAAPLAAPPANHGLRNPCVCLPPSACQPTPAGPDVSLPCLCLSALGLLSAVQPGVLGRIFAADDWAPHKPAPSAIFNCESSLLSLFTCFYPQPDYLLFVCKELRLACQVANHGPVSCIGLLQWNSARQRPITPICRHFVHAPWPIKKGPSCRRNSWLF
jgi:hypothetical protein